MFLLLQVTTAFLACVTFALSLAHALELPGKLRLDKETYCAMQTIYYPGFTVGRFRRSAECHCRRGPSTDDADPECGIPVDAHWLARPSGDGCHLLDTHPSREQFWLRGQNLGAWGSRFFNISPLREDESDQVGEEVWQRLRDRWEYSHVLRALLSAAGLLSLLVAVSRK